MPILELYTYCQINFFTLYINRVNHLFLSYRVLIDTYQTITYISNYTSWLTALFVYSCVFICYIFP